MARPKQTTTRRRWARRLLAVLAVLLLLAGGIPAALVYWYTRPAQVAPVVEEALAELTGCEVTVGYATVSRDGHIHLEDVTFRVPKLNGDYARLAHVDTVDLFGEPGGLLDGSYQPDRVAIDGLMLHLTEDADSDTYNFEQLVLPAGDGSADSAAIPEITIRNSTIRFGQRDGERVTPMGDMSIEGELTAEDPERRLYAFALRETDLRTGAPDAQGAELTGRFSLADPLLDLTVDRFSLAAEHRFFVPAEFRTLWSRLAPDGDVSRLTLSLRPDAQNRFAPEHTELAMDFERIGLNLDILGAQDPDLHEAALLLNTIETRLTDLRGRLVLEAGRWRFEDATGRVRQVGIGLSPVTYRIAAEGGLALDDPYTIQITADTFTLKDRFEYLLALSPLTGEAYRRFRPSGDFALVARFASAGGDAPPDWSITLDLLDAKITHELFPLPIHRLRGTIDITADRVGLDGLTGQTPTGGRVAIAGYAAPASDIAEVTLQIEIERLPIDEHLLGALKPNERDNLARFLNQDAYDLLLARGLISADGSGAPRFVLGGSVDVSVPIHRPYGEDADYSIVPVLDLTGMNALMADFPYPVTVTSGSVQVGPDFVVIDGLSLAGLTGGALTVDGRADKDPASGEYFPELEISDAVLPADALLFAAIGGGAEARLTELGVSGLLRIAGPIFQRPGDADVGMTLDVRLAEGSANPFGGAVTLHGITGSMTLHGKQITDMRFAGEWRGHAKLLIAGTIDWDEDDPATGQPITEADLRFTATDFFFHRDLLDLLPPESETRSELAALFDRYDPAGVFDAELGWRPRDDDAPDDYDVTLVPRAVALDLLGGRVTLTQMSGEARVTPEALTLDALAGRYRDIDGAGGALRADGTITIEDEPDISLRLSGETSAIGRTSRLLLPDKVVGVLDAVAWRGGFAMSDARLEMTAVGGDNQATSFDGTAVFEGVSIEVGGVPITEAAASLAVVVDDTPSRAIPRMSYELDASTLRVMDRRVTKLRGRADNFGRADVLRTDRVTGSVYGGTAVFEAALGIGEIDRTTIRASVHDARLDDFLKPLEADDDQPPTLVRDRSRGVLSGEVSLSTGYAPGSPRHGRGSIRVRDASLYGENPLGLRMLQVLNFNLPSGRGFDAADIGFAVDGETLLFTQLELQTPPNTVSGQRLSVTGEGTLTFPDLALDLRLRTGGGSSTFILGEVFNIVRNELVGIQVTGTLDAPEVGYSVLQSTRDSLNELLSGRPRVGE